MTQKPAALIVAHGQPSDPVPAAAEIAFLAAKVQSLMPGWNVRSATLAEPTALADRVAEAGPHGFVFPLFMAGGWFTRDHLPKQLAAAGGQAWRLLDPFGLDAGVQSLTVTLAREAAMATGHPPQDLHLLLAAHGSFRSPAPAEVAYAMAARIKADLGFASVQAAFIDQSPQIADVAASLPSGSIVLPFFAARGGHVIDDLPQALIAAGFSGTLLPPVGLDPRVPGLIRRALRAAAR